MNFIFRLLQGVPFGSNPGPDWMMWVLLVFGIGMPALPLLLRLEVEVRGDRLSYRMYLIHLQFRNVACHEIAAAEATSYRPLWVYGGWGIRRGKTGPAYTVFQGILGSGSLSWMARPFSSGHSGGASLLLRFPIVFLNRSSVRSDGIYLCMSGLPSHMDGYGCMHIPVIWSGVLREMVMLRCSSS